MSTQYVLVDFENVQPDLSALANTPYKVKIFLGAKQLEGRIAAKTFVSAVKLGGNLEIVEMNRSGRNAMDMHIAWYIGGLLEREPHARIHIISGDTDFDPLIEFLVARGVRCRRTKSINDLAAEKPARGTPAPQKHAARPAKPKAPAPKVAASEKLSGVLKHLRSMKDKPTSRTKLIKWIDTHFSQHGGAQNAKIVERTFDELVQLRFVNQEGSKVTYNLHS